MHIFKRIRPVIALVAITSGAASIPAIAGDEYYRWVGDDGVTHYGSRPPEGVQAEKISTYSGKAKPAKPTNYGSANKSSASTAKTEEQQQAIAMREEQCNQEKSRLAQLQQPGTRIRMQNEDGTSRYLTPEEISKEINSSNEFISQACK